MNTDLCRNQQCAADCGASLKRCGNSRVDTMSDPANCGACDDRCPSGVCAGGACM